LDLDGAQRGCGKGRLQPVIQPDSHILWEMLALPNPDTLLRTVGGQEGLLEGSQSQDWGLRRVHGCYGSWPQTESEGLLPVSWDWNQAPSRVTRTLEHAWPHSGSVQTMWPVQNGRDHLYLTHWHVSSLLESVSPALLLWELRVLGSCPCCATDMLCWASV
jgi:hypothetical protein